MVEQLPLKETVVGSSPTGGTRAQRGWPRSTMTAHCALGRERRSVIERAREITSRGRENFCVAQKLFVTESYQRHYLLVLPTNPPSGGFCLRSGWESNPRIRVLQTLDLPLVDRINGMILAYGLYTCHRPLYTSYLTFSACMSMNR